MEQVAASAAVVDELVPDDNDGADAAMRAQLADRYRTVRPFLELLGAAPVLNAAAAGRRVLAAVRALPELSRRRVRRNPLVAARHRPDDRAASLVARGPRQHGPAGAG